MNDEYQEILIDLVKNLTKDGENDIEIKSIIIIDNSANIISFIPSDIKSDILQSIVIFSAALNLSSQRLIDQKILGEREQIYLKGNEGYFLLLDVDSERVLIIITGRNARLGLLLLDARRAVDKISQIPYEKPEKKVSIEEKLQEIERESERIEKEMLNKKEKEEEERKKIVQNLKMRFPKIEILIQDKKLSKAVNELNNIRDIAKEYKLDEEIAWIDKKLDLCNKLEKQRLELEKINKIKKLVLELGIKFTRLEIREIGEKSSIDDEDIIIEVVKDMIKNKEIYAEYFSSSKAIAFDQQANIEEIDNLMAIYKEWEDKKVSKK